MTTAPGRRAACLAALLAVLLGACAVTPPSPAPGPGAAVLWRLRKPGLEALQSWTLTGRVAVRVEGRAWNARIHWIQRQAWFEIAFLSPFGQRLAELHSERGGVVLLMPERAPVWAPSAEGLLQSTFGWSAPVAGLRDWVRGLPHGPRARPDLDAEGRVRRLTESGWQVDLERYTTADGLDLPAKLRLDKDDRSVRLVIDRWDIGPAQP